MTRDIVHLHHPAPVRGIVRGGTVAHTLYVNLTSPVRLTPLEGDVEPMLGDGRAQGLYRHAGALWACLPYDMDPDEVGGVRVFVEAMRRATLSGVPGEFNMFLTRTPLLGIDEASRQLVRGGQADVPAMRALLHDGRDQARADLARYFAEEVRLWGDKVLVRCRGPVATRAALGQTQATHSLSLTPAHDWFGAHGGSHGSSFPTVAYACRPDLAQDHLDLEWRVFGDRMRRNQAGWVAETEIFGAREVIARDFLAKGDIAPEVADDDLRLVINMLPEQAVAEVAKAVREVDDRERVARELGPGYEALQRRRMRGAFGMLPLAEAEDVVAEAMDLIARAREIRPFHARRTGLLWLERYLPEMVLPRLRSGPAMAPDDAEAFAGMAP